MILDRVTITGADDSIKPEDLIPLSNEFPFVEWGILFSVKFQGYKRFPSWNWVRRLVEVSESGAEPLQLAAHLCGRWVRDIVVNGEVSWDPTRGARKVVQRIQLNFHGQYHRACSEFEAVLKELRKDVEVIFQVDGVNDEIARRLASIRLGVPLFDVSGGAGVLPDRWPIAWGNVYNGYAGGLGPDNVVEQIGKIARVAEGERIWIDMERRVRSGDDSQFDLNKVRDVLTACQPFINA